MAKKVKVVSAEEELDAQARARNTDNRGRRRRQKKRNQKLFGELVAMRSTADLARAPSRSMEQMLEEIRHRAYALWRYAAKEVDNLQPDEFWVRRLDAQLNEVVEPNKWIQYEQACRAELEDLGIKLIGLGLEERRVRIEEAEAEVVTHFLDMILDRLNLTEDQQQALPAAIDYALPVLEGKATERAKAS